MALAEPLRFHDGRIGALPLGGSGRDLAELIRRPAWMADALCREHPGVNFFPEERRGPNPAPVVEEALVAPLLTFEAGGPSAGPVTAGASSAPPPRRGGMRSGGSRGKQREVSNAHRLPTGGAVPSYLRRHQEFYRWARIRRGSDFR